MLPTPPGMAPFPSGKGMPPGMGMGGKPMPSALAAFRGGPPASVLASTLYVFGGVRLSAFPQTDEMDVFLSDRGRPHAFRGRARISSGVGMLTRRSAPDPLLRGLATMADGTAEQCFGSAEPPPLGMMGCCASLARPFAKRASGLRLVQSRAVSSVSSSDFTMGGIRAVVSTERRGSKSLSPRRRHETDKLARRGLRGSLIRRKDRSREATSRWNVYRSS